MVGKSNFKVGRTLYAPGLFYTIAAMLSFQEYASEKRILELLIKERAKVALKGKLKNISLITTSQKINTNTTLTIPELISTIMPPRNLWHRPSYSDRMKGSGTKDKRRKRILVRSITLTIKNHRKTPDKYPYLKRLDEFIQTIRQEILNDGPLYFNSISIMGKKKKVNQDGVTILRPICVFNSLEEKLLIALASKYLSEIFDPLLHEEILSYRPLRYYHNSEQLVLTDRDNAIKNLHDYRNRFSKRTKYVAECDILKYFDTINHDVIRRCFAGFAKKIKDIHPEFDYSRVERIVEAYLNSYSFYNNIVVENERLMQQPKPCKYEIPDQELFIERGCYSMQEFIESQSKIGIPQGGALSVLMSNVVLSTIDRESILKYPDIERFFSRYGDDIMLIHPSKERCKALIDSYCKQLTKNKLLYHEFISVADKQFRRTNGATRSILWDQKSRSPFLWGRCNREEEAVDWIGFLGYEMRYTGEVRMRRSSLNDKFKNIKRKYYSGAKTKIAKGQDQFKKGDIDTAVLNRIEKFAGEGFREAKSLTKNKYSITQAQKLNKYTSRHLFRLLYKIAARNNVDKDTLNMWWQMAKKNGCMNYIKTLGNKPNY